MCVHLLSGQENFFQEICDCFQPLERLGAPYHSLTVLSQLVKNYDELLKTYASGVDVRPIHETEVRDKDLEGSY